MITPAFRRPLLAALVALCGPAFGQDAPAPAAKPPAVEVIVDTTEAPALAPWAAEAKALVEEWHPKLSALLASDGFTPPARVSLIFKKPMPGVAGTSGDTIAISADWVTRHPEDRGMVVHELAHVIQAYPRSDAGWLVEGIADYARFFVFEPDAPLDAVDPKAAGYRDGYRTAARFLDWAQRAYDPKLVAALNRALREGTYTDGLFETATKKTPNALWAEFVSDPRNLAPRAGKKTPGRPASPPKPQGASAAGVGSFMSV